MPTRKRTKWIPRDDGQFDCRVGWMLKTNGGREQPKFRLSMQLGSDAPPHPFPDPVRQELYRRLLEK